MSSHEFTSNCFVWLSVRLQITVSFPTTDILIRGDNLLRHKPKTKIRTSGKSIYT